MIFKLQEVSPGRWKVENTLTGFEHHTYGTKDEVEKNAIVQSEKWKARLSKMVPAATHPRGWRGSGFMRGAPKP